MALIGDPTYHFFQRVLGANPVLQGYIVPEYFRWPGNLDLRQQRAIENSTMQQGKALYGGIEGH